MKRRPPAPSSTPSSANSTPFTGIISSTHAHRWAACPRPAGPPEKMAGTTQGPAARERGTGAQQQPEDRGRGGVGGAPVGDGGPLDAEGGAGDQERRQADAAGVGNRQYIERRAGVLKPAQPSLRGGRDEHERR